MGLDTLDEFSPKGTDPVSLGDDAIRETRASTKQSFGSEHYLDGPHKIPYGNTATRPAAGRIGRIRWNTDNNHVEYDAGDQWYRPERGRALASGISGTGPVSYPSGVVSEVRLPAYWVDSGGLANPQYNQVHTPPYDCWCLIHGRVQADGAGGLGQILNLESFDPPSNSWYNISSTYSNLASVYEITTVWPLPANRALRLTFANGSTGPRVLDGCFLTIAILGST